MERSARAQDVPPVDRPVGQPGDRRTEILDKAALLFNERGYHQTTVEHIADAVGLRKPTLYHYFKSKDEILFWIHEEFLLVLTGRLERRMGLDLSPSQQLFELMADILELMDTHHGHVRVFFEHHRELSAPRQSEITAKRDDYQAVAEAIIRSGIEAGEFRAVDVRITALALFGMCNWAYQWYRQGGPMRSREIAYAFWSIFSAGLMASPPTRDGNRGLAQHGAPAQPSSSSRGRRQQG